MALPVLNPGFALPGLPSNASNRIAEDDADPLKNPIFKNLSVDMQNQILNEAQSYFDGCVLKTSYAAKHNCSCLSLHFMNERLKHPDSSITGLTETVMTDCVDPVATAGYAYNNCIHLYSSAYPSILKPMCECYARHFARDYAAHPNTSTDYEINLGVQSVEDCRARVISLGGSGGGGASPAPSAGGTLNSLKP